MIGSVDAEKGYIRFSIVLFTLADLRGAPASLPPLHLRPKKFSIPYSFMEILAKLYVGVPGGLAPSPTENPGSYPNLDRVTLTITLENGPLIIPNVNASFNADTDASGKKRRNLSHRVKPLISVF